MRDTRWPRRTPASRSSNRTPTPRPRTFRRPATMSSTRSRRSSSRVASQRCATSVVRQGQQATEQLRRPDGLTSAKLDQDFGISKGLPGIAENLFKFLANLAAAPIEGMLGAIGRRNPNEGSYSSAFSPPRARSATVHPGAIAAAQAVKSGSSASLTPGGGAPQDARRVRTRRCRTAGQRPRGRLWPLERR